MDWNFILNKYLYNRRIVGGYKYAFKPFGGGCADEDYFKPIILRAGDVFLDIGANVGGWSIPASPYYREVHAFEANTRLARTFRRNLRMNNVRNVILYFSALGDEKALRHLHLYRLNGQDSFLQSHMGYDSTSESLHVQVSTLDSFKLEPSVIKIDTEGFELPIVRGALGTINRNHPKLCIETHVDGDALRIMKLLPNHSWDVFPRWDNTRQQIMIGV